MTPPTSVLSPLLFLVTVAGGARGQCADGRKHAKAVLCPTRKISRCARGHVPNSSECREPLSFRQPSSDTTSKPVPPNNVQSPSAVTVSWPREVLCAPPTFPSVESGPGKGLTQQDPNKRGLQLPAAAPDVDCGDRAEDRGFQSPGGLCPHCWQFPHVERVISDKRGTLEKAREIGSSGRGGQSPEPGGTYAGPSGKPGHDLAVREFEPRVGLWADGSEPGACFRFCVSLSLCPSPVHALSLSVAKINKRSKKKKKKEGRLLEVLMPSRDPPPARPELSPASTEKRPVLAPPWSAEHSSPSLPTSVVPGECTISNQLLVKQLVSTGDNLITLPENEAELKAFVVPAPPAETTYSYEWSLLSHPVDYRDEINERHMQMLSLSQISNWRLLSAGLDAFKVAVSGENAFGEGYVSVTVRPARRVNLPPTAVISPQMQALTLPLTSAFIDGSHGTDDMRIVSYRWEGINGPFREETPAKSPVLVCLTLFPETILSGMIVTDSEGATDSTTAVLMVSGAVDHPPVANAGPNQTITLPQNSISLNGNWSSDDHHIVLCEWSLGPGSESKEVAMQGIETPYLHLSEMQEGNYTLQLMVRDSSRQQSTAVVTVTVQPEINRPPVAMAGPDKELVFPVGSTTLDGSRSRDDQGIALYHREPVRGQAAVKMGNSDKAVATVSGLPVGMHRFRLMVTGQWGLSSASILTVAVRKENNSPPRAQAGGRHVLVLPNNRITLDGSRDCVPPVDPGRPEPSWGERSAGCPRPMCHFDAIGASDRTAAVRLTNLVEGVYTFHLQVADSQGTADTDTATGEVRPDPRKSGLVKLVLQVCVGQLTGQQKDMLVRQLAADVQVQKIQAHSGLSTATVFSVQTGPPSVVLEAADVVRGLHRQLPEEKEDFLLFTVLRVDTADCLLESSGHGHCDPVTKLCVCSPLWVENPMECYLQDRESNCEWSIVSVTSVVLTLLTLTGGLSWLCIFCCKRRERTEIRKNTRCATLDNMDDQDRTELRRKYGKLRMERPFPPRCVFKHRSTEHNSSLMVSESEFDSDRDTVFS
ncbi:Hypothetical predicted protein [Lynx pardinus]|uniref:PKD/Chitinase domain-containing protein n=1 Tax=Lynx pardinus TaxID=191816 RepID=A0A485N2G8_LYNPA|nr:Hypothetical predicted protein [Lynx pardinus]